LRTIDPAYGGCVPSPKESSAWLSLNSFVARLSSAGLVDGSCLAIWVLRHALEEKNIAKETANCNISAASEWIIKNGRKLHDRALAIQQLDEDKARATAGGPLYKGKAGLCLERWQFWKLQFSKAKDDVDKAVRKMVQQALNEMEKIEDFCSGTGSSQVATAST
jgi:hypothetical protein